MATSGQLYEIASEYRGLVAVERARWKKVVEELLKGGAHEGPCTNEGCADEEPCDLHIQAYERRIADARTLLGSSPL